MKKGVKKSVKKVILMFKEAYIPGVKILTKDSGKGGFATF